MLPKHYKHQTEILALSKDLSAFAIFWDQGTGKTRLALDTMCHLARRGEIDAMFIIAPNGVHQMWIEDEVPAWVPASDKLFTHYYTSGKAQTKRHQQCMAIALKATFPIVAMSYEAVMTKRGRAWARRFLKKRRVFLVCDESSAIKTPRAKRSIAIVAAGRQAQYKRILTGTPADSGPFDLYTQVRFLDNDFWKRHGIQTVAEFRTYFGRFETHTAERTNKRTGKQETYEYDTLLHYRNLEELNGWLQEISSRVEKDVVLDLPPKVFSKIYYELTPVQKRVYREIRDEAMTFLESGELVTVPLILVRLLRMQQVICGYIPPETGEPVQEVDPGKNPRMDALKVALAETHSSCIIWARFNQDIDNIMQLLGTEAAQCDGRVKAGTRQLAIKAFQAGDLRYIVSKPQTKGMSRGQTLTRADTVIFYSNTFSLEDRRQAEDRAHRAGLKHAVKYMDIVAPGTVDTRIVGSLRGKKDIAAIIMGDNPKEWL